jgi:LuxR family transcriptional regulator, maltose regulon positive regulatory protein
MVIGARTSSIVPRRELFGLLSSDGGSPVTLVSAPAGAGKTVLVRSWIDNAGLRDRVAWVTVDREEQDAQRFWLSVIAALRDTLGGLVERLEPAPSFDGAAVVERLISGLASLELPVLLVIDDLHELRSAEALRQLELLLSRRPVSLVMVLASRRDPRLGLHRLRLAGELTEIRSNDLRFSLEEARELLAAVGVTLSDASLARLHERTEGWAAGLRLAALALSGHPDPERFVAEFTGSERTVADYLFAEVLERQPEEARRLLVRTSVLDRVNGALADLLTAGTRSRRILQELEEQNAFVVSVDASREWFRYHRLFADMLRLELERSEPEVLPELHQTAAAWFEEHGEVVEAIRHFQAAGDWRSAGRLAADNSASLALDGRAATLEALLAGFPSSAVSDDAELALMFARGRVFGGSLEDAQAYIALAELGASQVPAERRRRFGLSLGLTRLMLARRRGDFAAALDEARPLIAAEASTAADVAVNADIRAGALLQLGIVELWSTRFDAAERHLEQGLDHAREGGRPYLEVQGLGHLAVAAGRRSLRQARQRALEAMAIAETHGWDADGVAGAALVALGTVEVWQGRFEEAARWLQRADQVVRPTVEPGTGLLLHLARGRLFLARGQLEEAAAAFRSAEQLEQRLVGPQLTTAPIRRLLAQTEMQRGNQAGARATLDQLHDDELDSDVARAAFAYAHLAEGNPRAAVDALAPVLDGFVPSSPLLLVEALLLDASAHNRLDERADVEADVERALELAEPEGLIWPFVVTPARHLLEHHPRHRTAHAGLLNDVLAVIAGSRPVLGTGKAVAPLEELSEAELRVLRYLPSNLSAPDIARELYLSVYTIKTHCRHIYAKLGVSTRREAVDRARELGLLAPSARRR